MTNPKVLNSKYFGLAEAIYNQNISFAGFDYGYAGAISKSRNFSGWQKKYKKSENDR